MSGLVQQQQDLGHNGTTMAGLGPQWHNNGRTWATMAQQWQDLGHNGTTMAGLVPQWQLAMVAGLVQQRQELCYNGTMAGLAPDSKHDR